MNKKSKQYHKKKAEEIVSQMNVYETISQLKHNSRGVKRLGVLPYNWWNECLHGVARAGTATVFPQAICMAAAFSEELMYESAKIISNEARAKFNENQRNKDCKIYKGLTMWSPNINIFRDPRWGRGQETYGEDPYLTGLLANAFIKGLQGDDEKYIKTAACAKHFAVHSGPEAQRHSFNASATKKDMFETYLPAFKKAVQESKVCGVMGAYNRLNGEACCASEKMIKKLLRESWGFDGYFTSDCGALCDIVSKHHLASNPIDGAAMAINAGCQLECGKMFKFLILSYLLKKVSLKTLKSSASKLIEIRSSLGMFSDDCPYNSISANEIATSENENFAVKMAEKGIVLLENNGILPLEKSSKKILIIGYNADNDLAYLGNYHGTPTSFEKLPDEIKKMYGNSEYIKGYSYSEKENRVLQAEALEKAESADTILVCTGYDCSIEGEENGEILPKDTVIKIQGDRETLELPDVQKDLLNKLVNLGKKTVIINFSGGAVNFSEYKEKTDAIIQCWYPGAKGGRAIANILFGNVCPSGKLPVTFYNSVKDLPSFEDYSMKNRTYRYFKGKVQYPFGYGLSYTNFELTECLLTNKTFNCKIKNTGNYLSDEVLQIYVTQPETKYENPIRSLIGIRRFEVKPQETVDVTFVFSDKDLYSINENGDTVFLKGEYTFHISDGQNISHKFHYTNNEETKIIEKCPI